MPMKVIVPAVPREAFDPQRPPSGLLRSQIQQLQQAVYDAIDSEGEAALCIRTLTHLLEQLRPQIAPHAHRETARRRRRSRSAGKARTPKGRSRTGRSRTGQSRKAHAGPAHGASTRRTGSRKKR